MSLRSSDQVMNCFFRAKIPRDCVENTENSGLFSAFYALNQEILSPEKFNPDLIRGSFKKIGEDFRTKPVGMQAKTMRRIS